MLATINNDPTIPEFIFGTIAFLFVCWMFRLWGLPFLKWLWLWIQSEHPKQIKPPSWLDEYMRNPASRKDAPLPVGVHVPDEVGVVYSICMICGKWDHHKIVFAGENGEDEPAMCQRCYKLKDWKKLLPNGKTVLQQYLGEKSRAPTVPGHYDC